MGLYLPCDCTSRFIKSYDGPPRCSSCGALALMEKQAKVHHQLDYDYDCPVTGKPIRSKAAHEDNLRRTGCHILEAGCDKDAARTRQEINDKADNAIAEAAAQLYHSLPQEKKDALASEIATTEISLSRSTLQ